MDIQSTPVGKLHGVGKARAAAYAKLHILTIRDLLYHFPRAYENRGNITTLAGCFLPRAVSGNGAPDLVAESDVKRAVILTVATAPKRALIRRGMSLLKFRAFDDSGSCEITFFNQDYLTDTFPVGSVFRFYGKISRLGTKFTMSSPVFEPYTEASPPPPFFPVYSLCAGLTSKQLRQNVSEALSLTASENDMIPEEFRIASGLCTRAFALRQIHQPDDYLSLATAKKRLIYDELFTFALGMSLSRGASRKGLAARCTDGDLNLFASKLPYRLTGAQIRAIREIRDDMSKPTPMSRIIVGDVGCGKTVCAAAAIYIAAKSGKQCALMVPTEILASQHYGDLAPLLSSLGISCGLLTSSLSAAEKRKVCASLASDDVKTRLSVVIGTQALLYDGVNFPCLGLVITDEQHRFGVGQRGALADKASSLGITPHLLVMSATPIPRSLALVLYGDLDISKIDEFPPGRQHVDTFVVDDSYRNRLDAFIRKNVDAGGQVYIVCPAVEEAEVSDGDISLDDISDNEITQSASSGMPPLKAAVKYAGELSTRMPDYRIAFVHGKLKGQEKNAIMSAFAAGDIQILVSTTVIEVGVNVPNATLMIVENAERFGLSQLHQLRGRVGRGSRKSYCILVSGAPADGSVRDGVSIGKTAAARLETMRTTSDGFSIAEQDLAMRGPGDFLATGQNPDGQGSIRQSGSVVFRLADMCSDSEALKTAFDDAKSLLTSDPDLSLHPLLKSETNLMFSLSPNIIS